MVLRFSILIKPFCQYLGGNQAEGFIMTTSSMHDWRGKAGYI